MSHIRRQSKAYAAALGAAAGAWVVGHMPFLEGMEEAIGAAVTGVLVLGIQAVFAYAATWIAPENTKD